MNEQMEVETSNYHIGRRIADIIRELPGKILQWLRLPGVLQPMDFPDKFTGDRIVIKTNERFTVVSVNNRDYYFRRVSGRFDGTGSQSP